MSEVYLGYDRRVKRRVAIKVLYSSDEPFVRRFEREALAIGTLSHNHILPLYDFGEQRPWYYLVMPYIDGGTLRDYLLKRNVLTIEEAGSFLDQIASALQHAHDYGVVHRDVKPSNILLRSDGYAYLADFGLAKAKMEVDCLSYGGTMIGTPEYMAPELSNGANDHRSDIYSLGIILYQMLTGRVPFMADSPVAVTLKHLQIQPTPPTQINSIIPASIEAVMLKALAKDPGDRYQQARLLAADYRKALRTVPGQQHDNDCAHCDKEEKRYPAHSLGTIPVPSAVSDLHPSQADTLFQQFPPGKKQRPLSPSWLRLGNKRPISPLYILLFSLLMLIIIIPSTLLYYSSQPPAPGTKTENTPTTRIQQQATTQAQQQATLAAQAHVQATAGITSTLGAGTVLYNNDMVAPGYGWLNDGYQCFFKPDGYHVAASVHTAAWCYYNQKIFSNVFITVQMQLIRGDIYGLVFHLRPGSKDFYVLELNNLGAYRLVRAHGNNPNLWLTLIDWTGSRAIASGYGHTNTILVITENGQINVYINKQLMISGFTDSAYLSGFIGFLVGGDNLEGTEAVFSHVWVFQK
jgi:serine/threonine protein kinase